MPSRSIYISASDKTLSFFMAEWYFVMYAYKHIFFIHSFVDGHT